MLFEINWYSNAWWPGKCGIDRKYRENLMLIIQAERERRSKPFDNDSHIAIDI